MFVQRDPPLHVTYCTNIYPAETLRDLEHVLIKCVSKVRDAVWPCESFGLGLRISARAAEELAIPTNLGRFKELLRRHNLYVFTINGFPYGTFQGKRIKEKVYAPDWRDARRLTYTLKLAESLADMLPDGVSGSVSTVPGSYRIWVNGKRDVERIVSNLIRCAEGLARIREKCGRTIILALEPEPDCLLETMREAIHFLVEYMPAWTRDFVGLCMDTCHLAVVFEDAVSAFRDAHEANIKIAKVQVSGGVEVRDAQALSAFRDDIYLHQVRIRNSDGNVSAWNDIPLLHAVWPTGAVARVHFHLPLYISGADGWRNTVWDLSEEFFSCIRNGGTEHLEIETYTFAQGSSQWPQIGVDESVIREIYWLLDRLLMGQRPQH